MSTYVINTIFIVQRTIGESYDEETCVLVAAHDLLAAEEYIQEKKAAWQRHIDFETALFERYKLWNAATPIENEEPILDYPRWGTGIPQSSITPAMRDERNRILAENEAINLRNTVKRHARDALWTAEYERYMAALGLPPVKDSPTGRTYFQPRSYQIKKIEVRAKG